MTHHKISECNVNLVDGLVWNEEVAGSNPAIPTKFRSIMKIVGECTDGEILKSFDTNKVNDIVYILPLLIGKDFRKYLEEAYPNKKELDVKFK